MAATLGVHALRFAWIAATGGPGAGPPMADRDAPRVLLFGTRFPPEAAGTAAYTRGLALGLASQGVEVHVLTMGPAVAEDGLPFPVRRLRPAAGVLHRYGRCLGAPPAGAGAAAARLPVDDQRHGHARGGVCSGTCPAR